MNGWKKMRRFKFILKEKLTITFTFQKSKEHPEERMVLSNDKILYGLELCEVKKVGQILGLVHASFLT